MNEPSRRTSAPKDLEAAAFYSAADGLAIFSTDGVLLNCNRAWERISGLEGYSVWIGKSGLERKRLLGYTGPELVSRVVAGASPATGVFFNSYGDALLSTASPHLDEHGKLRYVIITVRNLNHLNYLKDHVEQIQHRLTELENLRTERLHALLRTAKLEECQVASRSLRNVLLLAAQIAALDTTTLVYGETGTGKSIVARLIHRLSPRAVKPFIEVNCGAIPEGLVESELFGYQPGAFTGSLRSGKKGQIELAHGGILLLDEISELPLASQVKLLSFLDQKVIAPLGGTGMRTVDVRVIAATNKDLYELVKQGRFREDLLFRLDVVPLTIPPLRERREDIEALIDSYLDQYNREFDEARTIDEGARQILHNHHYPGNVRELKNLIARLVITARDQQITADDLPERIRAGQSNGGAGHDLDEPAALSVVSPTRRLKDRLEHEERRILENYARVCRSTYEIARELGVHHSSVVRKLRKYRIVLNRHNLPRS
jgi:transcriptional regulator with PAS, ATPase and Fis domain